MNNKTNSNILEGGAFFRTQGITIQESLSKDQFNSFGNLRSDEERVTFVYNLDVTNNIKLPVSEYTTTSEVALNLKNQGNIFFGKNNYDRAAKLYSHALLECPENEEILQSTLFANRSACFYYLKDYDRALQDIELAISLHYPKNLEYKIQDRKARCYLALNDLNNAVASFKKTMACLEISNLDTQSKQKKESDIVIMITLLTKTLQEIPKNQQKTEHITKINKNLPHVPNLAGTKNKHISTASSLVRIENKPIEGRFAVANGEIEPGEVLVVEKPHCSNLLPGYSKTHCQECFARVSYPIPCPKCSNIIFCSVKCRNIALSTYHKFECPILQTLWSTGSSIGCNLALRTVTQKGLKYFLDLKLKLNDKMNENDKYEPMNYRTILNLVAHEDKRTDVDFFHHTVMAVIMLKVLKLTNFFGNEIDSKLTENESYIGGVILRTLQILQFNAHEIAELQYNAEFPGELEKANSQLIGGGLYPTLSLFNHSCDPGIVRYFSGSKVIVKSVKSIPDGDIIAENYGPIYTQVSSDIRRAELKTHYWFDCNCVPCADNWPVFHDMKTDVLPFRCIQSKQCPGVIHVPTDTDEFMFPCPNCKEQICIFGSLKSLNDTEEMFKKGERLVINQSYEEALKVFIRIMKILNNVLKPPYKDFILCQQKIRSTMLTFGNAYQKPGTIKK